MTGERNVRKKGFFLEGQGEMSERHVKCDNGFVPPFPPRSQQNDGLGKKDSKVGRLQKKKPHSIESFILSNM